MADLLSTIFLGLVVGSVYALAGSGLVLTYRISGVYNFAQGAIGMFFAYLYFQLNEGGRMNLLFFNFSQTWKLPSVVALILVVGVIAPAVGWLLDAILFRKLRDQSTVVKIVATIGVLIALQGVAAIVWGGAQLQPNFLFPQHVFSVGGVPIPEQYLLTLVVVVALAFGLMGFLKFSPLGIRMRAVVDRPDVSELMGVNSSRVSGMAWGIGTGFGALAGILLAPNFGVLDVQTLTLLVVVATAAAVIGKLESIPWTLVGGLAVGIAQQLIQFYGGATLGPQLQPAVPFVVLLVALFLPIRWPVTAERPPPPPRRPPKETTGPQRSLRVGLIFAAMIVPALFATQEWRGYMSGVPGMALIFLSLVLLAGYAGQISLGQAALAGFGAMLAGHLVTDHGWPFLMAALAAALVTVPLGAILAFRATRLSPLFLGFATLAFGALMDQLAFSNIHFSNGLSGVAITRPSFLRGALAFYLFGLLVFGLFALAVTNIRRGKIGLALAAMRDSSTAVRSLGGSVARLKFTVFCVSAFMAAIGGAMYSAAGGLASPTYFFTLQSLLILALAVIGGINSWIGAFIGATLYLLFSHVFDIPLVQHSWIAVHLFKGQLSNPGFLPMLFGLGAIGLAQNPNGIVEQIRDGWGGFVDKVQWVGSKVRRGQPQPVEVGDEPTTELAAVPSNGHLVAFPQGRLYHRADCVLTVGKDGGTEPNGGLEPCPVCEPEPAPVGP